MWIVSIWIVSIWIVSYSVEKCLNFVLSAAWSEPRWLLYNLVKIYPCLPTNVRSGDGIESMIIN